MAKLTLEGVGKTFDTIPALDAINATIHDGEFVALLGPSGCGKSTILRLLAGFEHPTTGRIQIGSKDVANANTGHFISPEDRNIGFVFQSYALWPHMDVRRNVAFALEVRHLDKEQVRAQTDEALKATELTDYAKRMPSDLSGGQRQRVALARALVLDPQAVLLDEPLANLDVALRASMQEVFSQFHRRNKSTMVYVTHDQSEAMAMADRIAVMSRGQIVQFDTPETLYKRPRSSFVASFVGEGSVIPIEGLTRNNDAVTASALGTNFSIETDVEAPNHICLRPENLKIEESGDIRARVLRASYLGGQYRLLLETTKNHLITLLSRDRYPEESQLGLSIAQPWAFKEA
ncbi:ABC transporter ATP-binding protein [Cohaesibacter celericrescens]|uniref:ABC transporter ATP-binding protein n=1 Tax=Cohaesibacter celericrescens TaxID=2067669 RepID=UPI003562704D